MSMAFELGDKTLPADKPKLEEFKKLSRKDLVSRVRLLPMAVRPLLRARKL